MTLVEVNIRYKYYIAVTYKVRDVDCRTAWCRESWVEKFVREMPRNFAISVTLSIMGS